jgi:hypothetical protein
MLCCSMKFVHTDLNVYFDYIFACIRDSWFQSCLFRHQVRPLIFPICYWANSCFNLESQESKHLVAKQTDYLDFEEVEACF